jgi:hypothetical protein
VNDDAWEKRDCSKELLSKVIQIDLANFCKSREIHSGGVPYQNPPFQLPQCTVNFPQRDKGKSKLQDDENEQGRSDANKRAKRKGKGKENVAALGIEKTKRKGKGKEKERQSTSSMKI